MKELFKPHPNLSDDVNRNIAESELAGGAYVHNLAIGRTLRIQTKNTLYLLTRDSEGLLLSGHADLCPVPTRVDIHGSTWGGSMIKIGFIGIGMHMEFTLIYGATYLTTEIQSMEEV